MANFRNNIALGVVTMPNASSTDLVAHRMSFTLTGDVAINDTIEVGYLPAGCVPVDLIIDFDDLDSGASGTVSFGVLNTAKTDLDLAAANGGGLWLAATSVQAAGAARADAAGLRFMSRVVPNQNLDRPIAFKIVAETAAAANQVIGATLYYRAA